MRTKRKMVSGILAKRQRITYISLCLTDGAKKQELQTRPTESANYFRTLITDMICRLLLAFDYAYEAASEGEREELMREFIERIELFPEKQPDGNWIRKIIFNFPVPVNGTEVKELPLESETMVETVVLLSRGEID